MPRLVVPGLPHHVTQRGVRSTDIFRDEADRFAYLDCLRLERDRWGVEFLAWCLMTDHVHLVVVPRKEDSLARGIGEAHKRYTRGVNLRDGVRGHMFQGRFGSCVLDERHLLAAVRYVELNPVAAGIADTPDAYRWSSARFHLDGRVRRDELVRDRTLMGLLPEAADWRELLSEGVAEIEQARLERHLATGRPLGGERFVRGLEKRTGRRLVPRKGGWPKGRKRRRRGN